MVLLLSAAAAAALAAAFSCPQFSRDSARAAVFASHRTAAAVAAAPAAALSAAALAAALVAAALAALSVAAAAAIPLPCALISLIVYKMLLLRGPPEAPLAADERQQGDKQILQQSIGGGPPKPSPFGGPLCC